MLLFQGSDYGFFFFVLIVCLVEAYTVLSCFLDTLELCGVVLLLLP